MPFFRFHSIRGFKTLLAQAKSGATAKPVERVSERASAEDSQPVYPSTSRDPGLLPAYAGGILRIELHFLCTHCRASLRIDGRREGQVVECPQCHAQITVPIWSRRPWVQSPSSEGAALSAEEIDFLSGSSEVHLR